MVRSQRGARRQRVLRDVRDGTGDYENHEFGRENCLLNLLETGDLYGRCLWEGREDSSVWTGSTEQGLADDGRWDRSRFETDGHCHKSKNRLLGTTTRFRLVSCRSGGEVTNQRSYFVASDGDVWARKKTSRWPTLRYSHGGEAQDKTTNNANQLQVMSSAGYETSSGRQKEERRRDKITKSQHKRENRGYCE